MNLLDRLQLNFRCPANWDEMEGDDRKRFCAHCRKDVHNLSAMPRDEAEELVGSGGDLCVRMVRRADGTTKVADCPQVRDARTTSVRRLGVGIAASGALALASCEEEEPRPVTGVLAPPEQQELPPVQPPDPVEEVELLGDLCPPEEPAPPAPSEEILMGGACPEPELVPGPSTPLLGRLAAPPRPELPAEPK